MSSVWDKLADAAKDAEPMSIDDQLKENPMLGAGLLPENALNVEHVALPMGCGDVMYTPCNTSDYFYTTHPPPEDHHKFDCPHCGKAVYARPT